MIIGDAIMSECVHLPQGRHHRAGAVDVEDKLLGSDLSVEAPVAELRAISYDPACPPVTLKDGRKMTAVQLQAEYLELACKDTEDKYVGGDLAADALDRWESVLNRLAEDAAAFAIPADR